MNDPVFAAAFKEAKQRVRRMDLRYVAEADPCARHCSRCT
jgi:hypothetical protein